MIRCITILIGVSVCAGLIASAAWAYSIPWRAGESRQVGFGYCAKGPCTRRTYWGEAKAHRHVSGHVVFDQIVSMPFGNDGPYAARAKCQLRLKVESRIRWFLTSLHCRSTAHE